MAAMSKEQAKIAEWRRDPRIFVREQFGATPDGWQDDVLEAFPHKPLIALQAPLCVDSEIWTPTGRRRFGTLKPGDVVFSEDGTPTPVTQCFDVGLVPLFKVSFCDGTTLRVSADHLWDVHTQYDRKKRGLSRTVSTDDLMKMPLRRGKQRLVSVPHHGPVKFPHAKLPADPYVFGLWLGDGTANEPRLTCPDHAIRRTIVRRGQPITESVAVPKRIGLTGWMSALRETGVNLCRSYEKFIPPLYKMASVQQRLDLLRGLMDSDGTVAKNGQTYLATSSEYLAHDFMWLARSLGYYSTIGGPYKINDGENRDSYRVTISGPECPFLAETPKKKRWKQPQPYKSLRFIDAIESDGFGQAMCIEVPNASSCFLAADFIVTHNCKGPGKTTLLAWIAWNFLATRPDPNIAATSVSADQLRDGLWKEMAKWQAKSPFLMETFQWTTTRIATKDQLLAGNWWMSARTWPKTGNSDEQQQTLAGLHSDYILFLLDESGSIPDSVMAAAEAALSSCVEGHIVQAGNPTHLSGPLYRAATSEKDLWARWEITGDPDDPKRATRVHIDWARAQIKKYGIDHPFVLVNVLGRFPPTSLTSLIGPDEVRAAMRRYYRPFEIGNQPKIMGIDVARQGDDASVIAMRHGPQMHNMHRYRNVENGVIGASIANRHWNEFGADACFVDATGGLGFTWIDQLNVLGKASIPVQFSAKPTSSDRYANKRAEMYFNFVEWIKQGGALPPEDQEGSLELLRALTETVYTFKADRMILEDKDDIKAKIGFSPDEADACALTFAEPVAVRQRAPTSVRHNSAVSSYNPFAEIDRISGGAPQGAVSNYDPFGGRG